MVFEFSLGGYFNDHNYTISLKNNSVFVSDKNDFQDSTAEKLVSIENNEGWLQLLAFLKNCGWEKNYDSGILDGTQWELKVKGKGLNLKSFGSNAYPENFNEFIRLLNQVISPMGVEVHYHPVLKL